MKQSKSAILIPEGTDKVLLHACCAPCSGAIVEWMVEQKLYPTLFFCNPNIFPYEEYVKRKEELMRHAHRIGVPFVDADDDHTEWLLRIRGLEHEPERGARCRQCFIVRLEATAKYAHEHGFGVFTTTLASSRWKNLEQITEAGQMSAAGYPGLMFWAQNWRKGGLSERRNALIKSYDFYNQTYCGCEFSLSSARREQQKRMANHLSSNCNE
ncbi:epoxyqueuosine reductase QueH [Tannerella forsythia]|uniref:Epoxyqueuosine reductase QueH n=1 Tax=Tannerella forsythia TaxID=28112 RepID=A0A3P1XGR5_TANFO|nr:epoxyqueuosine reductase QueH [Tannerella forsythia]RRD57939.1 diacylglucosamine hydrolase [Tannerella forsythia]